MVYQILLNGWKLTQQHLCVYIKKTGLGRKWSCNRYGLCFGKLQGIFRRNVSLLSFKCIPRIGRDLQRTPGSVLSTIAGAQCGRTGEIQLNIMFPRVHGTKNRDILLQEVMVSAIFETIINPIVVSCSLQQVLSFHKRATQVFWPPSPWHDGKALERHRSVGWWWRWLFLPREQNNVPSLLACTESDGRVIKVGVQRPFLYSWFMTVQCPC